MSIKAIHTTSAIMLFLVINIITAYKGAYATEEKNSTIYSSFSSSSFTSSTDSTSSPNSTSSIGGTASSVRTSALSTPATLNWDRNNFKHQKGHVQVYGHRGARSYSPENTLAGYKTALTIGTDFVDMDVVMSKDGEVVVSHDLWLNPDIARDKTGKFIANAISKADMLKGIDASELDKFLTPYLYRNMSLAQIQNYDVGRLNPRSPYSTFFPEQVAVDRSKMPTLREVIKYVNQNTNRQVDFQIEIKTDPEHDNWTFSPKEFATAIYQVLREENVIDRAELQAFDFRVLKELRSIDSRLRLAYLTESDNEEPGATNFRDSDPKIAGRWTGGELVKNHGNSIPRMIKYLAGPNPACWEPEDLELTKESLDEAHQLGLKVVVWTWPEHAGSTFDPKLIEKLLAWGVDGIITDDPGRLISMLAARGYPVPNRYHPNL